MVLDPFLPNAFSRLLVGGGAEQPSGYQHDGIYNAALMSVPLGIAVRPRDGWLVVSNSEDDRLHLIDPGSRWVKSIAVPPAVPSLFHTERRPAVPPYPVKKMSAPWTVGRVGVEPTFAW